MPLTLYHCPPSGPSRIALLTARVLKLDVEVKILKLWEKEQLQDFFVKINPQHCVPTLQDDDFVLWESRAIASYLVSKYAPDDTLYPKEHRVRATVDRLLYFDLGTFYTRIRNICYPALYLGETKVSQEKKNQVNDALSWMEIFLEDKKYFTGDNFTIADIALSASASSLLAIGWKLTNYPKVKAWFDRCAENIPGFQENLDGAKFFGEAVLSKLDAGEI